MMVMNHCLNHMLKIKHAKCLSVGLKQDNALVCEVEHSEKMALLSLLTVMNIINYLF